MENMMSPADMRAVMGGDGMDGTGNSWWIIILFILLLGGRGFGNNTENTVTRADLCDGFNFNQLEMATRGVQQGLCDGFYAQNTTMLQGFNGMQRDLCQGFAAVNAGINENRFAMQNCCCETNRNLDMTRCDITTAIHAEGEATRALINANTVQELRDRLADRDRDLQTANFQLSQQAQNATLISELRPCARPAYLTCSPYAVNNNSCGCGFVA